MEQNPSIISHDAAIEQPIIPGEQRTKQKDNHSITTISVAVFVILSLASVAFLYFQNQKLKDMVSSYQATPSPTPTETPDPTTTWKIYTDPQNKFSFKYPQSANSKNIYTNDLIRIYLDNENQNRVLIAIDQVKSSETDPSEWWKLQKTESYSKLLNNCFTTNQTSKLMSLHYPENTVKEFNKNILIAKAKGTEECGIWPYQITFLLIPNNEGFLKVTYEAGYSVQSEQIISTFKFLENTGASPTPTQLACTQEAKLCPDGTTYVGRTGPMCEFAACPTTSY